MGTEVGKRSRQGLWEVGEQLASTFIGVNLGMD